ncbi:MAG: nucleotidyltransferase domain-containing protein [Bacteroides sp.]|nr:nucleotidyltransferase domain-containing protein [Bacteroides sp.]
MHLIEKNIERITNLCKQYRVRRLYVFGSILTDRFNDKSDVDFSVDFDKDRISSEKLDWANLFFDFLHEMEKVLNRKVDIVFDDHINNQYFRKELDQTKKLIYG